MVVDKKGNGGHCVWGGYLNERKARSVQRVNLG
jgi:hypothetical protein